MSNDLFSGIHQLFIPLQARFFRRLQIFTKAVASVASYMYVAEALHAWYMVWIPHVGLIA